MWQMGGFGPMLGQTHHFRIYSTQRIEYAIDRYTNEARRLYGVLDGQLAKTGAYVAGRGYSIADMAIFPWCRSHANQGVDLDEFAQVKRWFAKIAARPAVGRALTVLADRRRPLFDDRARAMLFGTEQYKKR